MNREQLEQTAKTMGYHCRYTLFVLFSGMSKNWEYIAWIQDMIRQYAKSFGATHTTLNPFRISDQNHFDDFILGHYTNCAH